MAVLTAQSNTATNSIPLSSVVIGRGSTNSGEYPQQWAGAGKDNYANDLSVFVDGGKGSHNENSNNVERGYRARTVSSGSYASTLSNKEMCRICHYKVDEDGNDVLIYPCGCKFSSGGVHETCVNKWAFRMKSNVCEICRHRYDSKYVPYIKQPLINWKFVPQYTRKRTVIAIVVLVFLLAITCITSYLLASTLPKNQGMRSSLQIVWPLVAVVSVSGMGLVCFLAWFIMFCWGTVSEYKEESSKHKERISVSPVAVQQQLPPTPQQL